ncbi:hypothetical protein ABIF63_008566 [Bradyrhizobium japonicum]|uniref:Transposase n=1 Tax=Bradyrhizobium japonicum TaxID=375 RepID=A0ABV2S5J3_BRAJP
MPLPTIMSGAVSGCGAELRLELGKAPLHRSAALIDHVLGLSAIGEVERRKELRRCDATTAASNRSASSRATSTHAVGLIEHHHGRVCLRSSRATRREIRQWNQTSELASGVALGDTAAMWRYPEPATSRIGAAIVANPRNPSARRRSRRAFPGPD